MSLKNLFLYASIEYSLYDSWDFKRNIQTQTTQVLYVNPRYIVLESTVTGIAPLLCQQILIARMSAYFTDLLHCTNEPNVSIPQLANLLIERTMNGSWIVVFKSLVTVHHLMCYGSERFTQYLASSNCTFNLASFNDRLGTPQVKTESRGGLSVGHIYTDKHIGSNCVNSRNAVLLNLREKEDGEGFKEAFESKRGNCRKILGTSI